MQNFKTLRLFEMRYHVVTIAKITHFLTFFLKNVLYRERYAVFLERIALYPDIIAFYWQKETIFSAQFCAVYSRKLSVI